jgi:hypothetical protein
MRVRNLNRIPRPRIKPIPKVRPIIKYPTPIKNETLNTKSFEIFAYCSENYKDAFSFVMPSWTKLDSVSKVTVYTDWDFTYDDPKVEVIKMFDPSDDWLIGTGRRLDVIKRFSYENKGTAKQILFLDIDCYIVNDVLEVFDYQFDIAISRLKSLEGHAHGTATAGLWFARLSPGYYEFIDKWFIRAQQLKLKRKGVTKHYISYVQYSFTDIAKSKLDKTIIYPIDENIYNSEHSNTNKWIQNVKKYNPKILHFKGRRFRDFSLMSKILKIVGIQ